MHIFISYAKKDTRTFALNLRDALRHLPGVTVWMDESLEAGESWALQIQQEIDRADWVVVLLSPDVNRPVGPKKPRSFVLKEIDYAQADGKPIIPLMVQRTKMPVQIAGDQYVDFTADEASAWKRLARKLSCKNAPLLAGSLYEKNLPPKESRPESTHILESPTVEESVALEVKKQPEPIAEQLSVAKDVELKPLAVAVESVHPERFVEAEVANIETAPELPPVTIDEVVSVQDVVPPAPALNDASQLYPKISVLSRQRSTELSKLSPSVPTLLLESTNSYPPRNEVSQSAPIVWRKVIVYFLAITITSGVVGAIILLSRANMLPVLFPAPLSSPLPTPSAQRLAFAQRRITHNANWPPVGQVFDGVEMVLVPAGCFMMGSEDGNSDELPVHEICFDAPFWMDRTEVTNGQYGSSGYFSGENRPRESVNWFDASAFCESRGARLPTEAEWEYAARGPDALVYPWGNRFVAENVVHDNNSNNQTAEVDSRTGGASWVGALDLSGNVWEWVSSLYEPYPYSAGDGREDENDDTHVRVLRGGSWNNNEDFLRAASRGRNEPLDDIINVGFRCVRPY